MRSKTAKTEKKANRALIFFKDNGYVLLSATAAFLLIQLVYFCFSLIPYGDMTILRMDLYHQYGPLFAELCDRVTSGASLVYSWNTGLGGSFLGNFFNYLSSPLSLLVLLFGHENVTEAISLMIALKATLSAACFTYYLKKSAREHSLLTAAFGLMYAFSGFFIAYYWNVMWLDGMVLLPLVVLGVENIIKKGKPSLFCASLTFAIVANYYMAFMLCVFSILYFLVFYFANYRLAQSFEPDSDKKKSLLKKLSSSVFLSAGVKFAAYAVTAALLAAFAILPLMHILSASSATSSAPPTEFKKYFTVFDFLANHLTGVEPTIRSSGDNVLPNVCCSMLTLILVPLFLFSKGIKTREKVSCVALLGVLYFSFDINYLNFFWHGLHFPNDLPYRFSFMYSFVLLLIAFKTLTQLKEFTGGQLLGAGLGVVLFLILVEKLTSKNVDDAVLGLSLAFAAGYTLILKLLGNKKYQLTAVSVLLFCTVVSEIALGGTDNYSMNQSKAHYTGDYAEFRTLKEELDERDGGFYRMELSDLRTRMDPAWYGYNGISVFSSMAYERVANMQQDVGMDGNYINSYTYNPQTPVYNAMFGLKYLVDNSDYEPSEAFFTRLMSSGRFTAYQNRYALPPVFAVGDEIELWNAGDAENPFEAQAQWFADAAGIEGVFDRILPDWQDVPYDNLMDFTEEELIVGQVTYHKLRPSEKASVSLSFVPEKDQNVYVYVKAPNANPATVSYSGFSQGFSSSAGYIVDIGEVGAGEPVNLEIPIKAAAKGVGDLAFYVYGLNAENFEKGYARLADEGQMNIRGFGDTHIAGTLTAGRNEIVYTSVPYDSNWKVRVDGRELDKDEILKISDCLLGFSVGEGEHKIVLKYVPVGLQAGAFITILTIIVLTARILSKRRGRRAGKKEKQSKWETLSGVTASSDDFEDLPLSKDDFTVTGEVRDAPQTPPPPEGQDGS